MHDLTHASFFSGVGGLDLGLERAGWRTVSFSEIDPYASAVLAERWPGVPNLGDITDLAGSQHDGQADQREATGRFSVGPDTDNGPGAVKISGGASAQDRKSVATTRPPAWTTATLWSGGFPCQDLSVAGKRAGFGLRRMESAINGQSGEAVGDSLQRTGGQHSVDGGGRFDSATRSGLAFAFLDLVERHRPPAILLENVPGLLSSNGGRDFGALLRAMGELGYGWAYRILDARHFGVPQRRRRVFIVGLHAGTGLGADRAAAVLSVGTRCDRHPATGHQTREDVAYSLAASTRGTGDQHGNAWNSTYVPGDGPSPDPGGVRAADGLAGRLDDSQELVRPLVSNAQGGQRTTDLNLPLVYTKRARVSGPDTPESWKEGGVMPTLNSFDVGDIRTTAAILGRPNAPDEWPALDKPNVPDYDDPLLPLGLDSHRYRCCGNGVVSSVSEWIGYRLAEALT